MSKLTLGLVLVLVLALALVVGPACGGGEGGAEFELSGLTITPSSAGVGENVSIKVTVENVGEEEGSTDVVLKVDGDEVDSKSVTVAAGATKTVTFTHSEAAAGTYAIKVDGESGTLTVTAGPGPTPTPTPGVGPGVGSTWDYLVDCDGEVDHPYRYTFASTNSTPPDYVCVPPAQAGAWDLWTVETNPDGDCPPNPTLPKRAIGSYTIVPMSVEYWKNPANGTNVGVYAPICMTAPLPLGLINGEGTYMEYTAVSGTVGQPYAVGDKWTYQYTSNAEILGDCLSAEVSISTGTVEVVAANETVTVPAGTFTDCFKLIETGEAAGTTTTWWSPTVQGIVKEINEVSYAPMVQTMELSAYNLK